MQNHAFCIREFDYLRGNTVDQISFRMEIVYFNYASKAAANIRSQIRNTAEKIVLKNIRTGTCCFYIYTPRDV